MTNITTATLKVTGTAETDKNVLYGMGGMDLIPFLWHIRDTTKAVAKYTDSPALCDFFPCYCHELC